MAMCCGCCGCVWTSYLLVFGLIMLFLLILRILITPKRTKFPVPPTYINPNFKKEGTPECVEFPSVLEDCEDRVSLTCVVPAYNEEERMPTMLDETISYLEKRKKKDHKFSYEIIIVDDGSRDRTTEVALEGALLARGDRILMVDADNATSFSDIERMEEALDRVEKDGCGIAVGSRAHLQEEVAADRKWYRNLLGYGFNYLVSFFLVSGIKDTQCGFKLFNRRTAAMIFPHQRTQRWVFDVELLYLSQHLTPYSPLVEVAGTLKQFLTVFGFTGRIISMVSENPLIRERHLPLQQSHERKESNN